MATALAQEQQRGHESVRFGPGGGTYRVVTTAPETTGRHFAFEAAEPPGGGPPLHTHAAEDEYFAVLDGEFTFYIDGCVTTVTAGGSAFVPHGMPHCFKNCTTRDARMLIVFTAGQIEGFFDYGLPVNGQRPSDDRLIERILEMAPRFGIEVLGPSPL
ncbi:MAG TPA: cupin domain-containing protein [Vicinamibacterales bacterium]|nr:cupin domain-containing protein [Vicinamibacterales bacterium]